MSRLLYAIPSRPRLLRNLLGVCTATHTTLGSVSQKLGEFNHINEMCWRDMRNVKEANSASVRSVKEGLRMARLEVVKKREKAMGNTPRKLPPNA